MDNRDIETLERETQRCIHFASMELNGEMIAWCCCCDKEPFYDMNKFMESHNCVDCSAHFINKF